MVPNRVKGIVIHTGVSTEIQLLRTALWPLQQYHAAGVKHFAAI